MKRSIVLIMCFLPMVVFGQTAMVMNSMEMLPGSNAIVSYNNEFGRFENREVDDSFPYAVVRMELQGDVREAKLRLSLDLGSQYKVESIDKNKDNTILFLIPRGARSIYLLCGDGCEKQQLFYGTLMENKVYVCKVSYTAEEKKSNASSDEIAALRKEMEELKRMQSANANANANSGSQESGGEAKQQNSTVKSESGFKNAKEIAASVAENGKYATVEVNGLRYQMVRINGGTYDMGYKKGERDEQAVHEVTLSSYYMGEMEVTQALWDAVMGTTIWQQRDKAGNRLPLWGEGDDFPMYYVSWEECQEFVKRLSEATGRNFAMPTEAQWEYAAREGGKRVADNEAGTVIATLFGMGYLTQSGKSTATSNLMPTGSGKANKLGVYDMLGNVSEWCSDWYATMYVTSQANDPAGPTRGSQKVVRGKPKSNDPASCTPTYRSNYQPDYREGKLGFRIVLAL